MESFSSRNRGWTGRVRDWSELVRIPNTFTTVADILAGYAIASGSFQFSISLLLTVLASIGLYWAGMILNDVNDIQKDQQTDRQRPVADGRISLRAARQACYTLIVMAVLAALAGGWLDSKNVGHWDGAFVAVLIGIFVLLYDSPLKATPAGPVLMGMCRGLNLLLGLSAGTNLFAVAWLEQPFWYLAPIAHTIFVAGFTTAARRESQMSLRWQLILGWAVAALGVAFWAAVPITAITHRTLHLDPYSWYPLLVALLTLPLLRRAIASVASLKPNAVQMAIKQSIMTLIFLDAAAALQFAGTTAGISVCILIVPMVVLGLRFRST